MDAVKIFFSENPEAEVCYTALGVAYADKEAADKTVVATNAKVETWTREGMIVPDNAVLVAKVAEQEIEIKQLRSDLAQANNSINAMGGPGKENKKIKELQGQLDEANVLITELQEKLAIATPADEVVEEVKDNTSDNAETE